ncbi:DUF4160 domain-containing protein [Treponema vincentii]|uniref:DUF4160 domain-containing protein n=1 Tax=Treponema TaxID=157 RepID=UPI001BB0A890|nr:DUF4160 domain-containing protein [Treponema vincentii]QUY18076.1 DUF4160 domain-containing protein [Treponema vincentii]
MPVLSRFYGIIIRMYFQQSEHNPPHIHALYGDDMAAIDIQNGEILEGHLPPKALSMVREWVGIHRKDLLRMWETQEFKPLSPLE